MSRALDLISLAAEAGADAAKFQHFRAEWIVSDKGFRELGSQQSHQASWKKSVFEVYQDASLPWEWTEHLARRANEEGIHFFTSPYDFEAIDFVDPFVPAFKVGSGDITWLDAIDKMASKGKPVILATGASTLEDVERAVCAIRAHGVPYALLQCNTNYTAASSNFEHIHLNVLKTFRLHFPDAILGLSDHTLGHTTVLGAVSLGARIVEKHLTDDNNREGPDHHFSMTPATWSEMVARTRELESALGLEEKIVAGNEAETIVLQRRGLRFARHMKAGESVQPADLVALRPATPGGLAPFQQSLVVGRVLKQDVEFHDAVFMSLFN